MYGDDLKNSVLENLLPDYSEISEYVNDFTKEFELISQYGNPAEPPERLDDLIEWVARELTDILLYDIVQSSATDESFEVIDGWLADALMDITCEGDWVVFDITESGGWSFNLDCVQESIKEICEEAGKIIEWRDDISGVDIANELNSRYPIKFIAE